MHFTVLLRSPRSGLPSDSKQFHVLVKSLGYERRACGYQCNSRTFIDKTKYVGTKQEWRVMVLTQHYSNDCKQNGKRRAYPDLDVTTWNRQQKLPRCVLISIQMQADLWLVLVIIFILFFLRFPALMCVPIHCNNRSLYSRSFWDTSKIFFLANFYEWNQHVTNEILYTSVQTVFQSVE